MESLAPYIAKLSWAFQYVKAKLEWVTEGGKLNMGKSIVGEIRRVSVELPRLFLLNILVVALIPSMVFGEVNCSADVSYRWLPRREAPRHEKKDSTPSVTPTPEEPVVMKWATVTRSGGDEPSTRSELQRYVSRERQLAMNGCREMHENLARCITAKFSSAGQAMVQFGFTARKALEEAIQQDCEAVQGQCRDVVVGEIACATTAKDSSSGETPASTPEEPATKDAGKEKAKKK